MLLSFFLFFCILDAPISLPSPQEEPLSPIREDSELVSWLQLHGADQESINRVSPPV